MKKYLLTILAVLGLLQWAPAQQRKINAANEDTEEWRYTIQNEAVGDGNTALVCVHSYSKSIEVAREQCLKNAIHGLIFRGAPGKDATVKGLAPLVNNSAVEHEHSDFFQNLFRDGGEYRRYATVASSEGVGSVVKKGKEYDVRVYVTVQYADLRRRLEQEGILVSMGEVAETILPRVIVVPSDEWCITRGYYVEVDRFGPKVKQPDYRAALLGERDLLSVIVEIGSLMKERGLDLDLLEENLKRIEKIAAEEEAREMDGNKVKKTNLERLRETVKADFWIKVSWSVKNLGPRAAVDFTIVGVDAYSDRQVAAGQGSSMPVMRSALNVTSHLRTAVAANIEQFNRQLMTTFEDILANGRIVTINCICTDAADFDYETELDGGAYVADVIEDWVADNALNGKYSLSNTSTNNMSFDEVRMPLQDTRGRTLPASRWIRGLKSDMKNRYNLPIAVDVEGKGNITVTLGAE